MSRVERDPERGRAAAAKLKALGVKGILIKEAEQGYITQLACKMPECFCPSSLEARATSSRSPMNGATGCPPSSTSQSPRNRAARRPWDNAILAHRLCNRLDHSLRVGRSHRRDLERIRKAREEGIRRNNVLTGNTEGGEIPTVVATVEAIGEPADETEPDAEAATLKPMQTKKAPEWKSLPDAEKAQYLLDHQTISDRTWTDEPRLPGERRDAFIHRILGFPKAP